jgi:AraC-like DNA-binding protein
VRIYIKNMVSQRCKLMVEEQLSKLGLKFSIVELGVIELPEDITHQQREQLRENLEVSGLEILDDVKSILTERIKNAVVEMIHYSEELPKENYSNYLAEKIGYDYTYLSNIFSEVKGITLQQYIINNKIERVKEFLLYDELTLTEISYRLHYSSVAHLSSQFKKTTGFSPSFFRKLNLKRKGNLEDL